MGVFYWPGSTFFDPATLSVIHPNVNTLSITPYGAFTPNSRTLWVLNSGSSELVVIDPTTNEVVDTTAVPASLGIAPGEGKSLLIGSLGLAIASTELGEVVRSASGEEDGSAVRANSSVLTTYKPWTSPKWRSHLPLTGTRTL